MPLVILLMFSVSCDSVTHQRGETLLNITCSLLSGNVGSNGQKTPPAFNVARIAVMISIGSRRKIATIDPLEIPREKSVLASLSAFASSWP